MASNTSTSLIYVGTSRTGWHHGRFGEHSICMAVCEVVNHPTNKDAGSGILVVPNENCVATRYLLVSNGRGLNGIDAANLRLPQSFV